MDDNQQRRKSGLRPHGQKNSSRTCPIYCRGKSVRQLSTFATHSTTTSPQKHHALHSLFPKIPCKNCIPPAQTKSARNHRCSHFRLKRNPSFSKADRISPCADQTLNLAESTGLHGRDRFRI